MMKNKKYDYYRAVIRRAEQLLEITSLDEFIGYANANHLKQIIVTQIPETGTPAFAVASKGALYICASAGFHSLEDFQTASENNFPDAATFYAGQQLNCTTYAEYQTAQAHSITDASIFEEMKKKGYVDGFGAFDEMRRQNTTLPRLENIQHVKDLFDYAQQHSFRDFQHFMAVWQAGFISPLEHQIAIEKGLKNAGDFEWFNKGGFQTLEEFKIAKAQDIRNKKELYKYLNLQLADYPGATYDQLLLISIISQLENDSVTEFRELYAHFVKSAEGYRRSNERGEPEFPAWFTRSLLSEADVRNFLVSSREVKNFGTLDAAKDLFETKHIQLRMVVVDGSNVAYNSNMADRRKGNFKAELKNILILVKKLKEEYKFEDVHVISDNQLYHVVKDKELLKDIKALCKYSEAPPGIPADLFLISYVKKHHCLLVTNDNFSDWKTTDKWVEDHLPYYRLKFVLNGEIVLIPYMDKYKKK